MAEGWGGKYPAETGRRGLRVGRCWIQSSRPMGVWFTQHCSHSWDKSVDCSISNACFIKCCTDDKFWQLHNSGVVVLDYYFQNSLSICNSTYCRLLQTILLRAIYIFLAFFFNHNPVTRIYFIHKNYQGQSNDELHHESYKTLCCEWTPSYNARLRSKMLGLNPQCDMKCQRFLFYELPCV